MSIEARYRIERDDFTLDVAFTTPARGVTAVFGSSGSGKTTLLRAIAGLERAPDGYLRVDGDVWQDGHGSLPAHRRPVGYVFQEPSLFSHLSVRRNLEYGYRRIRKASRRVRVEEAIELLGLSRLLERSPSGLSGGERQRVAIARALLTSPRLLLMDEPMTALDARSKAEILPYLERLHEDLEVPVLYVGHAPDEVARIADHMILLEAGRVLGTGPISEMLTRFDLPLAHGGDAESIIEATVSGHDEAFELTRLEFSGGTFVVVARDLPVGRSVRLRVLARDVSLTLERQTGTSILNVFPAVVERLAEESPARTLVRLRLGDTLLLARITRKSAHALRVEEGRRLFVQIKSVALLA